MFRFETKSCFPVCRPPSTDPMLSPTVIRVSGSESCSRHPLSHREGEIGNLVEDEARGHG